jgi:hypothetical protein
MPSYRSTLTRAEQREYLALGRKMNAAGAMLDLSALRTPDTGIRVQQTGEAYARTCPCGSVYAFQVSILCLGSRLVFDGFDVGSPDWPLITYLLGDPFECLSTSRWYRMIDGSSYERDSVLNHRVDELGALRRGERMEGFFLAQASAPIPESYNPGSSIRLVLTTRDELGGAREWIVRVRVQPPYRKVASRSRSNLFELKLIVPASPTQLPLFSAAHLAEVNWWKSSAAEGTSQFGNTSASNQAKQNFDVTEGAQRDLLS